MCARRNLWDFPVIILVGLNWLSYKGAVESCLWTRSYRVLSKTYSIFLWWIWMVMKMNVNHSHSLFIKFTRKLHATCNRVIISLLFTSNELQFNWIWIGTWFVPKCHIHVDIFVLFIGFFKAIQMLMYQKTVYSGIH